MNDGESGESQRARLRVLFVEHNEADAFYARAVLGTQGREDAFRIEQVSNLKDATARLADSSFDVALVDLAVHDGDPAVVQTLRNANPRLPIVVMTTNNAASGVRAIQLGADDFVHKSEVSGHRLARLLELSVVRRRSLLEPLSNIAEPVIVTNGAGVVRMINNAAEVLLGRLEAELVGTALPFVVGEHDADEVRIPAAGGERVCEVRRRPIQWHGEPAVVLSLRDVTDRHAAADLRNRLEHSDKLATIGQMAAGVAHEINNPTMAMKASLELLEDAVLDADDRELLATCEAAVRRIQNVVNTLSAFSRMEKSHVGPVDLNDVVDLACRLSRHEIRHRAELRLQLSTLPPVSGDLDRLAQVVLNLLVNAAHALDGAGEGPQHIDVETLVDGDEVVLRVRDTGQGIAEGDLERIFEPFYTTKRAGIGTGLGLSLASDIVGRHRGTITARSVLGVGTTMEIRLPRATEPAAAAEPAPEPPAREPGSRVHVLLVDDDELVRRSCARLLRTRHQVTEVGSGEEALDAITASGPFDVVLTDVMMPGIDGPALFERVVRDTPEMGARFGFFTGGAFTPRSTKFIQTHDVVVLDKPITKQKLLSAVEDIARRGSDAG